MRCHTLDPADATVEENITPYGLDTTAACMSPPFHAEESKSRVSLEFFSAILLYTQITPVLCGHHSLFRLVPYEINWRKEKNWTGHMGKERKWTYLLTYFPVLNYISPWLNSSVFTTNSHILRTHNFYIIHPKKRISKMLISQEHLN